MLCLKVSSNRVFFVNEYWILIPLMIAMSIAIIVKVKKNRAEKKLKAEQLTPKRGIKTLKLKLFHIYIKNHK